MRRYVEEIGFVLLMLSPLLGVRNVYKSARVTFWAANVLVRDVRLGWTPSLEAVAALLGLWGMSSLFAAILTLHLWAVIMVAESRLKRS